MTIKLSSAVRTSRANVISAAIDNGSGDAYLTLYSGTRPSSVGGGINPVTNLVLGELKFSVPCASAAAEGVLTFNSISQDVSANNNGTCTWARITNRDGVTVMDLDVSINSGSGDIKLNSVDIIQGGPISIISASLTEGNA
jgi:hypothetical protein